MSPNLIILLENLFWIKMLKNGLLCQIQSRHLNIFRKFRKPMTRAKGHVFVITKIILARELRYERRMSWIKHPTRPIKDRLLLTMMWFLFTLCALVPIIKLTLLCVAHKYRLICKIWNTLISSGTYSKQFSNKHEIKVFQFLQISLYLCATHSKVSLIIDTRA